MSEFFFKKMRAQSEESLSFTNEDQSIVSRNVKRWLWECVSVISALQRGTQKGPWRKKGNCPLGRMSNECFCLPYTPAHTLAHT